MLSRKLLLIVPVLLLLAACSRDPKVQAKRLVEQGNKFYDKTRYREAVLMYRRALNADLRYVTRIITLRWRI